MADQGQLERLRASILEDNRCVAWNQWHRENRGINIDLYRADLDGADLDGAYLSDAHLAGANLVAAHLSNACLIGAHLRGANFRDANLRSADLRGADLTGAAVARADFWNADLRGVDLTGSDLRGADLTCADLTGARLIDADLTGAHMYSTTLVNLDLHGVIGVATIMHHGPSHIATDTLYISHGEIPDIFLRGCGLPDEMIGFVHSIAGAIQYYSIFISYNHQDEAFVTCLYNDLQANNVRCWKYTEDIKTGDDIFTHVDQAIRLHDKLLVVFSKDSVASEWVRDEVEAALEREKHEGKQVLFPVTIDDSIKQTSRAWAARIRRKRNITNFAEWEHQQQYQLMFDRLLRDLKADSR